MIVSEDPAVQVIADVPCPQLGVPLMVVGPVLATQIAAALRAAGYPLNPDEVSVPREALRRVLDQRVGHSHRRPGIWDPGNGERSGRPCAECAARTEIAARLDPSTKENA